MRKQIWKYAIEPGLTTLEMPKGAQILSGHVQSETPHIWAMVDPSAEREKRYFLCYGTGYEMLDAPNTEQHFIASYVMRGGTLVVHVFERITKELDATDAGGLPPYLYGKTKQS